MFTAAEIAKIKEMLADEKTPGEVAAHFAMSYQELSAKLTKAGKPLIGKTVWSLGTIVPVEAETAQVAA